MSITLRKINNEIIKPIKVPSFLVTQVKGGSLFAELYGNIYLLAKKKSGKTNVIFKILKKCTGKNTTVIIFCSTAYNDDNWPIITKWLKTHKINSTICTSIYNDDAENQIENLLNNLIDEEKERITEEEQEIQKDKTINIVKAKPIFDEEKEETDDDEKKETKIAPEYILVFDDMSGELSNATMSRLLKNSRHFKMKVIVASQYYNDIDKDARTQFDYILMWPRISEDKLLTIYTDFDLDIPYDLFKELYHNATSERFNFFYVDTRIEEFRKNFSMRYNIKEI